MHFLIYNFLNFSDFNFILNLKVIHFNLQETQESFQNPALIFRSWQCAIFQAIKFKGYLCYFYFSRLVWEIFWLHLFCMSSLRNQNQAMVLFAIKRGEKNVSKFLCYMAQWELFPSFLFILVLLVFNVTLKKLRKFW